jgi:low affinity Fe/Cu permease
MSARKNQDIFTRFTTKTSEILGRAWVFVLSLVLLGVWALTGPILNYSDTWQLVINTTTTIITFLMVFIIQNTQNRAEMAVNLKLDALLDAMDLETPKLAEAESRSDKKLEKEQRKEQRRARKNGKKK